MMTSLFFRFLFNSTWRETGYFFLFLKWFTNQIMVSKRNILEWKSSHGVTLNSVAIEKSPFKIKFKLKMSPKGKVSKVSRPFSKPNFLFLARFQFKTFLSKIFYLFFFIENAILKKFY